MAPAQGDPSILRATLSQGVSVVLDGRVLREQNDGDFVPIHDIDLQGSPGTDGQGSLTPIVRIPSDFGLKPTQMVADGVGFGLVACPRDGSQPSYHACALRRVAPRRWIKWARWS
ncbi:MAG: hypothetical protein Q6L60_04365 [Thermostichus sp. HHBFW_bins_43]